VSSAAPQPVIAQLTKAAIFLVVTIKAGQAHEDAVRAVCSDLAGLLRAVGFRDLEGRLSCVMIAFRTDVKSMLLKPLNVIGEPMDELPTEPRAADMAACRHARSGPDQSREEL